MPRRNDSANKIDLDELAEQCATFSDPMPTEPPKLWVAWIYKDFERAGEKYRFNLIFLFFENNF